MEATAKTSSPAPASSPGKPCSVSRKEVMAKGYGILPKYVMLDPELPIEAKAIYAYFCSFAGQDSVACPLVKTTLANLHINKQTYNKYLRLLKDQGYITVCRERSGAALFGRNFYTLENKPAKFLAVYDTAAPNVIKIKTEGLRATGYGLIPKAIMSNPQLPLKAKGIYAYLSVFADSNGRSNPRRDNIKYHLGIGDAAYYSHYNLLQQLGYISVIQVHQSGRLSHNRYSLTSSTQKNSGLVKHRNIAFLPSLRSAAPPAHTSKLKASLIAEKQFADVQFTEKQFAGFSPYNNNTNSKITNLYNYQSSHQQNFLKNDIKINNLSEKILLIKNKIGVDTVSPSIQSQLEPLIAIIAEALVSSVTPTRFNHVTYSADEVTCRLENLTQSQYLSACERLRKIKTPIFNKRTYILTVLFNAAAVIDFNPSRSHASYDGVDFDAIIANGKIL